jgi:L-threonylcarbamoyladenylate synthase
MEKIDLAVEILKKGEVVAAPTETVYGLFADASNDVAIQKIYEIKGRPICNPLIVHVSDVERAKETAKFSEIAESIAQYFWIEKELPLTIILPNLNKNISKFVTAGLSSIALRRPNHKISRLLIEKFGSSLAAPSANTSTFVSPTSFEMVKSDLGAKIPLILDGGSCSVGLESTILDLTQKPFVILRPGGVSKKEIETFLGEDVLTSAELNIQAIKAPGMMEKHYSPNLPVRINSLFPQEDEAFIAFGKTNEPYDLNLSLSGDLKEAAQNLFRFLKLLDNKSKFSGIAIMPIPNFDIGVAINDRITRASAT